MTAKPFPRLALDWMRIVSWQSRTASAAYTSGTLIQGVVASINRLYEAKDWHAVLKIWAIICFGFSINAMARWLLLGPEEPLLVVHMLDFFRIMVPIVILAH